MQLKSGTKLQNGKYEILRMLGQGGFGITYEAEQVALHRRVAIKEFFMKDYCERDEATSHVTLGATSSNKELVDRFRKKFIKEAQSIAALNHPNIVKIIDIFEENGTAYYVMNYLQGGSLADLCIDGCFLTEDKALAYVRQIASALDYLYHRTEPLNHLDIKPSNVLLDENGNAVLIDFGISKRYDEKGCQTSNTPVGISHGYSPLEQYKDGGVQAFSPATDIYSLGATLYKLLTGITPPQASDILESGVPETPGISSAVRKTIVAAMQPRRIDRPQSLASFLALLTGDSEEKDVDDDKTMVLGHQGTDKTDQPSEPSREGKKKHHFLTWFLIAGIVLAFLFYEFFIPSSGPKSKKQTSHIDTLLINGAYQCSTLFDAKKSQQSVAYFKNFMDSIVFSLDSIGDWCSIVFDQDSIVISCLENNSFDKREQGISLLKTNDSTVLACLSIIQNGADQPTTPQGIARTEEPVIVAKPTTGSVNGHEWVDLGLSVKWATCNVGASSPRDYGSYYAWGETKVKSDYLWETYKWCSSTSSSYKIEFVKYNTNSEYGTVDNRILLELSDDAARANWGEEWRIPTDTEWTELRNKCKWIWTTQDGKKGCRVTSKTNGNSIFLPAAGYQFSGSLMYTDSCGYYSSSSLDTERPADELGVLFHSSGYFESPHNRFIGTSVRPVIE